MLYLTGMFSHLFNDFFYPRKTYSVWSFDRVSVKRRAPVELLGLHWGERGGAGGTAARSTPVRPGRPGSAQPPARPLPSPLPDGMRSRLKVHPNHSKLEEHKTITPVIMFKRSILLPWLICTTKRVITCYSCQQVERSTDYKKGAYQFSCYSDIWMQFMVFLSKNWTVFYKMIMCKKRGIKCNSRQLPWWLSW